ncbi:F-box/kelch-repeat protein At3g06240-like [Papaver somniferum]|uniref:F-box/kelch-repeat protein At3g06240-like n=1 Tax=Papaver somniferum TaxID=3469 RepID=UPI000E6FD551|nr:F-box/kelch-repeat protein At3g06240-like [Papaver somniferum]
MVVHNGENGGDKIPVKNGQLHYFEYSENHDQSTTPIHIITKIQFPVPFWVTREYVLLPVIKRDSNIDQHTTWTSGFGYSLLTNEYKVVGIYMYKTNYVEVYIYTLGSGRGWRNLGKFNSQFSTLTGRQGIFVRGSIYWMGTNLEIILTFDLVEEKFGEHLSPPPLTAENVWCIKTIGILDGFLFFANGLFTEGDYSNEIWILKKKNDNDDMQERGERRSLGWSKEFRFDERGKLLAFTRSGGVLTHIDNYLVIYDPIASSSKILVDYTELFCQAVPHKNTLVSFQELGEEDARIMESADSEDGEP